MRVPLKVTVLTGPPGMGKSHHMRGEIISEPGLSVLALPTIVLLREQEKKLREAAPELPIFTAHSSRDSRAQVQLQVNGHLQTISKNQTEHAVLLVTHDFLVSGDLAGLAGWRFYVDEPPAAVRAGRLSISKSSLRLWRAEFNLQSVEHWGRLERADGSALKLGVERGDTMLKDLAELRRAANGRNLVLISTNNWVVGEQHWMTMWTPLDLPSPARVTMAGAGYLRSLGAKVAQKLHGDLLEIEERLIERPRSGHPQVTIRYFVDWECSSPHWETWDGLADLRAVADHIRTTFPNLGYWSGNDVGKLVMSHRISPEKPWPARLAGLDGMMDFTACAYIYSSKAAAHLMPLLDLLGLSKEDVRISAEDEDIFQFVFRGAIRKPDYAGDYDIYLFSRQQAERLHSLLDGAGLTNVALCHEQDALVSREPPKGRRKPVDAGDAED